MGDNGEWIFGKELEDEWQEINRLAAVVRETGSWLDCFRSVRATRRYERHLHQWQQEHEIPKTTRDFRWNR